MTRHLRTALIAVLGLTTSAVAAVLANPVVMAMGLLILVEAARSAN